ncbi:MAG TPA: CBS domain-containing protein [candidate division Zixibacteria bacterium]|nr:CBS domain-containing protein [candidate division Zixibacteria bacterium]
MLAQPQALNCSETETWVEAPVLVSEIMTGSVLTVRSEQRFTDVVSVMAQHSFHHVLVADAKGCLCGVISDRDILRSLRRMPDWERKSVSMVMTRDPVTVPPDAPISRALKTILSRRVNCLPVVDEGGKILGIVTTTDLLKAFEKIQLRIEKRRVLP